MQGKSMLKTGIYLFLFVLLGLTGCNKFKGDQEVPSYIRIDSINISPASASVFGFTPSHNITDVWITIDGWNIGGYQLPATIPVLKRGEQKVLIQAGILANNLSLRRTIYPFYSGVEFTVNFVEDSVINVTLKEDGTMQTAVAIRASNKYPLSNESFERGYNHSFDTVPTYNSVPLEVINVRNEKISHPLYPDNPDSSIFTSLRLYEEHIGRIHLTKDSSCCCIMSKEACSKGEDSELPYNKPIYIEIDYLTNNIFEVGIVSTRNGRPFTHPVVVVGGQSQKNPQWSKIYVDISNAVTAQIADGADDFKILIRAYLEENNDEAYIYLDNIRLVH